jgi:demethylmenaquinone methyltransferase/2-methoxy-6-polyprenyl-1,4-benzoquinol methylase
MVNMELRDVYIRIPGRYESTNHALTLGLDVFWRRAAAREAVRAASEGSGAGDAALKKPGGGRTTQRALWLDLCSGTGETAALLSRFSPEGTGVIAADFSPPMLREGIARRGAGKVAAAAAAAEALPFRDGTFRLVTVTFAARNLGSRSGLLEESLMEIRRVLVPGGVFVNLETSQPSSPPVRKILHAYAGRIVARLGAALTGERDGYTYLSGSIRSFHGPEALAAMISRAGFSRVTWRGLTFGVVAIHKATA